MAMPSKYGLRTTSINPEKGLRPRVCLKSCSALPCSLCSSLCFRRSSQMIIPMGSSRIAADKSRNFSGPIVPAKSMASKGPAIAPTLLPDAMKPKSLVAGRYSGYIAAVVINGRIAEVKAVPSSYERDLEIVKGFLKIGNNK